MDCVAAGDPSAARTGDPSRAARFATEHRADIGEVERAVRELPGAAPAWHLGCAPLSDATDLSCIVALEAVAVGRSGRSEEALELLRLSIQVAAAAGATCPSAGAEIVAWVTPSALWECKAQSAAALSYAAGVRQARMALPGPREALLPAERRVLRQLDELLTDKAEALRVFSGPIGDDSGWSRRIIGAQNRVASEMDWRRLPSTRTWVEDRFARALPIADDPEAYAQFVARARSDYLRHAGPYPDAPIIEALLAAEDHRTLAALLSMEEVSAYLAAYRARCGRLPSALNELAGALAVELPVDPWRGESLAYATDRKAPHGYRLWIPGYEASPYTMRGLYRGREGMPHAHLEAAAGAG